ncbi:MAG: ferrous iron transport protein B [Bacteroidota bacterium]|nr:ferrous iron transport protein B [Bacteroidota bacterium]
MKKKFNLLLLGNPNTGKSSLFNKLTGLNQKVGNFSGVTVEKKEGNINFKNNRSVNVIDLPGTYSVNSFSPEEEVVSNILLEKSQISPDAALVVSDIENLKHNLLLFTQVKDLGIPLYLIINMCDVMKKRGITLDISTLEEELKTKIFLISTRNSIGIDDLFSEIPNIFDSDTSTIVDNTYMDFETIQKINNENNSSPFYKRWLSQINKISNSDDLKKIKHKEAVHRYRFINNKLNKTLNIDRKKAYDLRSKLDNIFLHPFWGTIIFMSILALIFQTIFTWSSYPMDFIDEMFSNLSNYTKAVLPEGVFTNLLAEGIITGIGGVVIFVPQIALLFVFISILEETGYMSRVVFLFYKRLKKYGLSGKSIIPLISGVACAIPAVMSTRNIEDWKQRLTTILIVPFMTCSARLPVYLILISIVIPDNYFFIFNYQGLTLLGLYLLAVLMALISAFVFSKIIKSNFKNYVVIEMPNYKIPVLKNVLFTVYSKTKSFVFEAGKIILSISILLWILASNGPGNDFKYAEQIILEKYDNKKNITELDYEIQSYRLENSYIGTAGKILEPILNPLGYDWKIGIAIITSFAAREVFVGTLATIFSVGSENVETIKEKMSYQRKQNGQLLFNLPTGVSLMVFYAFALQCMSTIAIVKKETNSWKWPAIQFIFMTIIAYISALIVYQTLS